MGNKGRRITDDRDWENAFAVPARSVGPIYRSGWNTSRVDVPRGIVNIVTMEALVGRVIDAIRAIS